VRDTLGARELSSLGGCLNGVHVRDLRYALRQLARSPGFTVVAGLTLALGIGACVAIFSVVDGVLLRPLPYPESDRLVVLQEINLPRFPGDFVRPGPYDDWRRQATSFEGLAAVRTRSYNLTGVGEPVRVAAARITANTLSLLRAQPALGRDFRPEEDIAGRGDVVILDHGFWVRQLGGRREILHARIDLDGQPFTVVGIMPAGFRIDSPTDLYLPGAYLGDSQIRRSVGPRSLVVFGRLKPAVTVEQARQEMRLIAARLETVDAGRRGWGVKLTPMLESRVGDTRPVLATLLGAVSFLLLLACANITNLLLARATARAREIAVRVALGASRGRIVRQLVTESVLLSSVASALGVLVAWVGIRALVTFAPASIPRADEIGLNARALAVTCALALLTGVGFGLVPALGSTRLDLHQTLRAGRRAGDSRRGQRLRSVLVVVQVAIALVLLAGAGLLARSFAGLQTVERGYRTEGALTFTLALSAEKYGVGTDPRMATFAARAAERIAALPGVQAAGASQALPFSVDMNVGYFEVVGRPTAGEPPLMYVFECTPGYFAAMGISLLRGRLFDAHDDANRPRVAIVNESLAKRYFPGEDPIGKRLSPPGHPESGGPIVGVVADVRDGRVSGYAGDVANQVYVPLAQNPYDVLTFVVRQAPGFHAGPAELRAAVAAVDPDQPIGPLRPLADWVAESIARQRLAMLLFVVFSIAALSLAALGVYGVMAYTVTQRTAELGIRIALGARSRDVVRLVLGRGGRLVAIGLVAGLLGALALTRFLTSLLFGISVTDPLTLAAIAALLSVVAAVACLLPARRATKVDPMTALRAE
jgi:putative ABC transport system permease protein